ncbi:MAG: TonB-dependent receptor, partial [Verrucomicrobia bacterium]|nr:TonB-dependent receptor [Verrucomicrobiota bacterium]
SADTQGWLVQGGAGTLERGFGSARYGGTIADGVHYRVYGSYGDHGNTTLLSDAEATNDWQMARGGFRVDVDRDPDNVFMFEGDGYAGWERQNFFGIYTNTLPPASLAVSQDSLLEGADAVAHWTHTFSDTSSFKLQADYDYTGRKAAIFDEQRHTGDINAQQQFALGNHNTIEAGLGYRVTADSEKNNPSVSFIPESQTVNLYSGFVQDEIALVPDKLTLTPGTKVEHNDYTGFEFEPGGRLAWTPTDKQTFWASVSRAVRTPTRVEETVASTASKTIFVPFPVVIPVHVYGMNDFGSETLMAYELGYRVEPVNKLSLDFAAFYNDYGDLRSAQLTPSGSIILGNDLHGHTYGIEASGDWRVMDWWRLRPSYTFLKMKLFASPDGTGYSDAASVAQLEGTSPQNQFSMASEMDFPHGWTFDAELRYVDSLTWDSPSDGFPVSSYIEMNARLAWQMNKHFEAAIVGENLLHDEHSEFGATEVNVQPTEIPRSIYGEISCRF